MATQNASPMQIGRGPLVRDPGPPQVGGGGRADPIERPRPGLSRVLVAVALGLVAGCSSALPPAPSVPPPASVAPAPAPSGTAGDQDTGYCQRYAVSAASGRTPIEAMRNQEVLGPFIALIELGTRQVAEQGTSANDPAVAAAMREVVAAVDELDAQATAALPPGAKSTETTVKLDPNRLAAALDGADRACAPRLAASPPPTR